MYRLASCNMKHGKTNQSFEERNKKMHAPHRCIIPLLQTFVPPVRRSMFPQAFGNIWGTAAPRRKKTGNIPNRSITAGCNRFQLRCCRKCLSPFYIHTYTHTELPSVSLCVCQKHYDVCNRPTVSAASTHLPRLARLATAKHA